jgi:hypothetical protein
MRKCKCGNQVASNAKSCPQCGHRFTSAMAKGLAWFIGFICLVSVLGVVMGGSQSSNYVPSKPAAGVRAASSAPAAAPKPKAKSPADLIAARKEFAKIIDQQLLESGIESETFTSGPGATTLVIKDALAGRVRQNSIQGNDTLFRNLRELGFKHLRYTNAFEGELNFTVEWNITS